MDGKDRARERLRERCSFHLFVPMLETYFFGEPDALVRAGAKRPSRHDPARDLEQFEVDDAEFLAPSGDGPSLPDWAITPLEDRRRHPKRYLQFLCDPAGQDRKHRYRETSGGRAALRTLAWDSVLARAPQHVPFLSALFNDIADGVGAPTAHPVAKGTPTERRAGGVLRNL